jgi:hypothetical protein
MHCGVMLVERPASVPRALIAHEDHAGRLLDLHGDVDVALRELERARDTYEKHGAKVLAARVTAELSNYRERFFAMGAVNRPVNSARANSKRSPAPEPRRWTQS